MLIRFTQNKMASMIKNILFDLDGTLLPMDMERFTNGYFKLLVAKLSSYGFDGQEFIKNIWIGIKHMVMNDGSRTNAEAFWDYMQKTYGERNDLARSVCESFYANEFDGGKDYCGFNKEAARLVADAKKKGYRVILATNPIFPDVATVKRTAWAGLSVDEFEGYTTYENCSYCKPNPKYYEGVVNRFGLKYEECLMVGNDADEDLAAESLGIKVFLLCDCLINKNNKDISKVSHGSFGDLRLLLGLDP